MKFTKMHGLGNDFILVDTFEEVIKDPQALARAITRRRVAIGADGLILIGPSEVGDFRMTVYNADGSAAQMCGNGLRCAAKYAVDHGLAAAPMVRAETDAGLRTAQCHAVDGVIRSVRVDMGFPSMDVKTIPCTIRTERVVDHPLEINCCVYSVTCLSMGNPHAVVFVDDLDAVVLERVGPAFEHAPVFPQRINTHFARLDSPTRVTVKTWERGSGETSACGTGACAVCVAGVLTGRTRRRVTAALPGGDLQIQWSDDEHVYMTGPAVEVFSGEWHG